MLPSGSTRYKKSHLLNFFFMHSANSIHILNAFSHILHIVCSFRTDIAEFLICLATANIRKYRITDNFTSIFTCTCTISIYTSFGEQCILTKKTGTQRNVYNHLDRESIRSRFCSTRKLPMPAHHSQLCDQVNCLQNKHHTSLSI